MFGFISTAAGVPDWMRNFGADFAEAEDKDGEGDWPGWLGGGYVGAFLFTDQDRDVFPLGTKLYESGANDICSVLSQLPAHTKSSCKLCTKPGRYDDPFLFQQITNPTYY